jgi:hypothetical protein
MAVYYKCKICGEKHLSPVAYTKEALDSSTVTGQTFKCPKTGQAAKYDLIDLFWEKTDTSTF